MSFRKESSSSNVIKTTPRTDAKDQTKKGLAHQRSVSESPHPIAPPISSFNSAIKQKILDIEAKAHPDSILQFLKFIRIYRDHNEATRDDILNNDDIVKKITKEMIATFLKKKKLSDDLVDAFVMNGINEKEARHLNTILLHKKIQERLKKDKIDVTSFEIDVVKLSNDIVDKLKKPATVIPIKLDDAAKKTKSRTFSLKTSDKHHKTADNAHEDASSDLEASPPSQTAAVAPTINVPSNAAVYSDESETADKEIDVILTGVKKHLARLKEEAAFDPLKKDVYYAVDNLYSQCHVNIKAEQRATKDTTHRSILKANECMLLKELDLVLVSIYKSNDAKAISPDQFGKNILAKREALKKFESATKQMRLPESLLKAAAAVGIALGVTVACAVIGTLIGIAAFAWTGPGMALGAFKGAFIGGSIGWAEGIILASIATGVSTSFLSSWFGLFKMKEMQKQINFVSTELNNVIEKEDRSRFVS